MEIETLKPNIIIPMDYHEQYSRTYALGKTPLSVRVERFVDWYTFTFGSKPKYIPIHTGEYNKLCEAASWTGVAVVYGTRYWMLPLGARL